MLLSVSVAHGPGPALRRLQIGTECEKDAHRAIGREAEGGRRLELGNDSQRRPGNQPALSTGSLVPARGGRSRAEHQCWPGITSLCRNGGVGGQEPRGLLAAGQSSPGGISCSNVICLATLRQLRIESWHLWDCCLHHGRPCVCAGQMHSPLTVPAPRAAVRSMCATPGRAA